MASLPEILDLLLFDELKDSCEAAGLGRPRSAQLCKEALKRACGTDIAALVRLSVLSPAEWNEHIEEFGGRRRRGLEAIADELASLDLDGDEEEAEDDDEDEDEDEDEDDDDDDDREGDIEDEDDDRDNADVGSRGDARQLEPGDLPELQGATFDQLRGATFLLPRLNARAANLFSHQREAVDAVERNNCSGIVHMPTGAGKTRVALELVANRLAANPNHRVAWVSHSLGLLKQTLIRACELGGLFPPRTRISWGKPNMVRGSFFQEDHLSLMTRRDLTGILADAAEGLRASSLNDGVKRGLAFTIVYDECHELGASDLQRAARRFFRNRPELAAQCQFLGLSATPLPTETERHALLSQHVFPVPLGKRSARPEWNVMVHHTVTNEELVEQQVLCEVNTHLQDSRIFDLPSELIERAAGGVGRVRNGTKGQQARQFVDDVDRAIMESEEVLKFLAGRIASNLQTLGKTLVFVPTIRAANRLTQLLAGKVGKGNVTLAHSRMNEFAEDDALSGSLEWEFDYADASKQISEFQRRKGPCVMVNVGMLTTGFDDPGIRSVILARNTTSTNLFWQMIGRGARGLRVGGTAHCFVIDPLRLGDRFNWLHGYLPSLAGGMGPVDEGTGALDPSIPLTANTDVAPGRTYEFDPGMRAGVRDALVAFLRDGVLPASEVLGQVAVASSTGHRDGRINVTLVAASKAPEGAIPATRWAPVAALEKLMVDVQKEDPNADLSWLRSPRHWPQDDSHQAVEFFLRRLEAVRRHSLFAESDYERHVISRL